jgi:hypothetical protein
LFIEDFTLLSKTDPVAANLQRQAISARFVENLAAEGITLTDTERRVQETFTTGEMSVNEMLNHVKLYVASIESRYGVSH